MASNQDMVDQNKARPVSSVKGKPIIVIEQFLNPERGASASNVSPRSAPLSKGKPKVVIEQFLNPERGSSNATTRSPNRSQTNTRSRSDPFTPPWYHSMPQWFRDAHPLASGGGMLAPPRSYAPLVEAELTPQMSQLSISDRQSKPNQRYRTRSFFRSRSPPESRGQRSASDPNWSQRRTSSFQGSHRKARGGGYYTPGRRNAPKVRDTSRQNQSQTIRRQKDRTFYRSSSNERQQRPDPNDIFTPPWYYQMPKEFRDAHPLAPGGGMLAPPKSKAPVITNDMHDADTSRMNRGTTSGQRTGQGWRGNRQSTGSRRDSDRVWVPKDRIIWNTNLRRKQEWRTPSVESRPTVPYFDRANRPAPKYDRRGQNMTPNYYWGMPKKFRDGHPLAPGGGLLSPGRSYAPPPPDYTGPNIEKIMQNKNVERLRKHTQN